MKLRKMLSYAMLLLLCVCAALAEDVPAEGEAVVYRDQELVEYPEEKTDDFYAVPEGVTRVNVTPFWNLHLRRLSIPASCTEVAFWGMEGAALEAVEVAPNHPAYASVDGVVYNQERTRLLFYPPARAGELFIVPSTVEGIAADAFSNCQGVKYLLIPAQVLDIEAFAFDGSAISEIILCGNETDFSISAFNACPALEKIWVHPGSAAEKRLLTDTEYIDLTPLICYW